MKYGNKTKKNKKGNKFLTLEGGDVSTQIYPVNVVITECCIINILPITFSNPIKNGDMIAICNCVEYLRRKLNKPIKFHFLPGVLSDADYCQKFYRFLLENTDYFSDTAGKDILKDWNNVNLWDYRSIWGDIVKIKNKLKKSKKIVIFPIFNASYNEYRNWTPKMFEQIVNKYKDYTRYEKIICKDKNVEVPSIVDWKISTDFMENINHIMTAEIFIGGETGTSQFVGALENGPSEIVYYYSGRSLMHTVPFNLFNGKGKMVMYFKDSDQSIVI